MALILSADFEALPTEPTLRWLKLRDLLERRLESSVESQEGRSDSDLVEYWSVLANAADELNVGSLPAISHGNIRQSFEVFQSEVIALATRLSLRTPSINRALSVALERPTRAKIHAQIERLRKLVASSELDAERKNKLNAKLDELQTLITAPRTDFGKTLEVLAFIAMVIAGTTSFLADAPDALTTITAMIAADKEAEESEQRAIEVAKEPLSIPDLRHGTDSDEIPF